jgi:uncharacterized membrane protein
MNPLLTASAASRSLSAAAALLALALTGADLNSQVYVVTDLGTLPGTAASFPVNLNDNGDVVGYCTQNPASMNEVGFVWHNGVLTSTGKLTRGNYSSATAISNSGLVAGDADTGNFRPQGWIGINGKPVNFFSNNGGNTHVLSINDAGVIGGFYTKSLGGWTSSWKGALWFPDTRKPGKYNVVDLPVLPGSNPKDKATASFPLAFNRSTQAVGYVSDSRFGQHACFWDNNTARSIVDLGTFSDADGSSLAYGINDVGQAVGSSHPAFGSRAILWDNDASHTAHELPLLPGDNYGSANAINSAGTILGSSTYGTPGTWNIEPSVPVVWIQGQPRTVEEIVEPTSAAGWTFSSVNAINNAGQIVGSGTHNGASRAFLLTPVSNVESPANATGGATSE